MRLATHCMVDIETLAAGRDAMVLSIGAVEFDPFTVGELGSRFYTVIDPVSAQQAGLRIDAATIMWWMNQGAEARGAVFGALPESRVTLASALEAFLAWYRAWRIAAVWANAPTFDLAILRDAFAAIQRQGHDVRVPWHYRDERDFRTACRIVLGKEKVTYWGLPADLAGLPKHHALADAARQAVVVQEIYRRLKDVRSIGCRE